GKGRREGSSETIKLQGLHFHRSGLAFLGLADGDRQEEIREPSNRGRKPTYDWQSASAAIWGKIYRGDFQPTCQADIERALQTQLAIGDKKPSESSVRPLARIIWDETKKA
ncbi:MAG: hypothetical protein ABIS39_04335, partial [Sphingomicrobium sp.]